MPKKLKKPQRNRLLAGMLLAFLVCAALVVVWRNGGIPQFSLWPGVEGLDAGVVGYVTPWGSEAGYYRTNEQFPWESTPIRYKWSQWPTVDPFNCKIYKDVDFGWSFGGWKHNELLVERQQPTRDTSVAGRKIEYWIPGSNPDESIKVVGHVVPWVFNVQLSIVPGTDNPSTKFDGSEGVWFGLGTKVWNRATYQDPDDPTKYNWAGWSIPLSVYIESYDPFCAEQGGWKNNDKTKTQLPKTEWVTECVQISPALSGRTVTLFTDPTTPVSLDDVWYQGGLDTQGVSNAMDLLNASLGANPSPDSRFANHAYFKFDFSQLKTYKEVTDIWGNYNLWFPSVFYRLRVYYLELGEFVYVQNQEELPWWDVRQWGKTFSPFQDLWIAILKLNPFWIFGDWAPFVAFLFTLFILAIVILVILAIVFPGAFSRLVKGGKEAGFAAKDVIWYDVRGKKK